VLYSKYSKQIKWLDSHTYKCVFDFYFLKSSNLATRLTNLYVDKWKIRVRTPTNVSIGVVLW